MDNTELLQAMQAMMKEEISGLRQEMAANNESLRQEINDLRQETNANFDVVNEQLADIKEDTEITRSATNSLIGWAEQIGAVTQVKFPLQEAQ